MQGGLIALFLNKTPGWKHTDNEEETDNRPIKLNSASFTCPVLFIASLFSPLKRTSYLVRPLISLVTVVVLYQCVKDRNDN